MWIGRTLSALLAITIICSAASAQDYPSATVKMVVGFAPGGGNDIMARLIADRFKDIFRQPFVVENKPGASGIIAIETVKRSAPDGLTLLVGPSSGMTVNPVTFRKLPYDSVADFEPIGVAGFFPLVVAVHPSLPVNSIAELIAYAKERPGQINYASAASSFQMATEMFAQMAGITLTHVPYRGSTPAVTAVVANEVSLTLGDLSVVLPQVAAGNLKALAISTAKRSPALPDIPTVAESGLPEYEMVLWSGLFAPAGTPKPIIERLHKEMRTVIAEPKIQERFATLGVTPSGMGPDELKALMRGELVRFATVADKANIKFDN